jgi:flagellar biosynthesis anti-sigma factor FlgM
MSVKIDQNRPPGEPDPAKRLDTSRRAERPGGDQAVSRAGHGTGAAGTVRTDRVEVSTHAHLLSAALQSASSAPDVRLEQVERARRALEAGALGRDPFALADRMIDEMVKGS